MSWEQLWVTHGDALEPIRRCQTRSCGSAHKLLGAWLTMIYVKNREKGRSVQRPAWFSEAHHRLVEPPVAIGPPTDSARKLAQASPTIIQVTSAHPGVSPAKILLEQRSQNLP